MIMKISKILLLILCITKTLSVQAADCQDSNVKEQVTNALVNKMNEVYIFADKAETFKQAIVKHKKSEKFKGIKQCEELESFLNEMLAKTTKDGHLQAHYSPHPIPIQSEEAKAAFKKQELQFMKSLNYGIEAIERFAFNIGYINLSMFAHAEVAAPTIAAAMNLVAHTDALIIDLRYSRGGDPATVDLIASYLLNQKTNTSNIYYRNEDKMEHRYTSESVEGTPYGENRPVYILTSKDTYSAAEDFAYTMKHLGRAKVVGEVTGGGAHPGDFVRLHEHFEAFIPNGRSINPITKTNWEGVGVQPNIETAVDDALNTAQSLLLNEMMKNESDPRRAQRIQKRIERLNNS